MISIFFYLTQTYTESLEQVFDSQAIKGVDYDLKEIK